MPVPRIRSLDVFQAAGGAVDQVFALATAVDAAGDMHLVRIVGEFTAGVVEDDRGFGRAGRLAVVGAFEDDVGHLLAAQALGALRPEDPFDGVDDVRFTRPVGPDHDGDPVGEIEAGSIGKAFEAGEFESFQHACESARRNAAADAIGARSPGCVVILSDAGCGG